MLKLPKNRRLLSLTFLAGFLPAYLLLVMVGSGCSGGCDGFFRLPAPGAANAVHRNGGFTGDVFFGYRGSSDSTVLVADKKKTDLVSITMGMPVIIPAGKFSFEGDVSVPQGGSTPPKKYLMWLEHRDAEGKKQGKFKTILKRRGDDYRQKKDDFKGFDLGTGDSVVFVVKPKKGDLAMDQLYHFFFGLAPSASARSLSQWMHIGASMGAGLVDVPGSDAPDGGRGMPVPPLTFTGVAANAAMSIFDVTYNVPLPVPAMTASFQGTYVQADASSNVPNKVDFEVVFRDSEGGEIHTARASTSLTGNTIPNTSIQIPELDLPAGATVSLTATPRGGNIENGDQMQGFVVFIEDI